MSRVINMNDIKPAWYLITKQDLRLEFENKTKLNYQENIAKYNNFLEEKLLDLYNDLDGWNCK